MRFEQLRWGRLPGRLHQRITAGAKDHLDRPVTFLALAAEGLVGVGELAALTTPGGSDPTEVEARSYLSATALPRLRSAIRAREGHLPTAAGVAAMFGTTPVELMVAAAIEQAVLDLELQAAGTSLSTHLGVVRSSAMVGALVGRQAGGSLEALEAAAAAATAAGIRRLRVKIWPGDDYGPLAAVRAAAPRVAIQADANGTYRPDGDAVDGPPALRRLDDLGLVCIEQPFAATNLVDHAQLRHQIGTPVALDESLRSIPALAAALRYGALDVACIKPGRLGGLLQARRALAMVAEEGVAGFVGGYFESGWGRAGLLALSGLAGATLPGDLTAPSTYSDLPDFGYPAPVAGTLPLARCAGVGPSSADAVLGAVSNWELLGEAGW